MAGRGNTAALSLSHPHSSDEDEDDASGHRLTPLALPPPAAAAAAAATPEKAAITHELGSSTATKKKPRGRPPGSKNKPKPPVVVVAAQGSSGCSSSSSSAMRPVVLEISAGSDVVGALTSFALRRRMGLAVLSGSGSVSEVTLRHPLPHAPPLSLRGPFNLLSLSGSVLGGCINDWNDNNESKNDRPAKQLCRQEGWSHFGITLAGAQGQVFGGVVGGKVVAATPVVVAAATFVSPSFHRFPSEGGDHQETKPCIGGGRGGGGGSDPPSCPSSAAAAGGFYCGGGGLSGQATSPELMPWGGAANAASRPPY
ncbi:AT-hook motif nuclear-localized protein 28-like [Syzygium oleosum]|uniref:AT-hook motif nuclear-localized protein 28-like n=1 Tax=Syzygium oleosum TaxID=219896 RepID=UPI0011D20812|nr:AT-hook motif nuclear-localized protein 28-like [Syzygium oleosum]